MANSNIDAPITNGFDVTPNDSVDLATDTRGIYVGVSGNIKVTLISGTTLTFIGLVGGVIHPIQARRIHATDTTATNLIGVY